MNNTRVSIKFFLLIITFLLFSCGRKAPPLPIEKSIPEEASLELELTPLGVELYIVLPAQTKGGYPLNKISYLEIEKIEEPLEVPGKKRIKSIKLKPKLHSAGRLLLYRDEDLKAGYRYTYRLRIKKDFLVGTPFYGESSFNWTDPPQGISNLVMTKLSEREILLSWEPPKRNLRGGPLRGELFFQVERSKRGEKSNFNLRETSFRDTVDFAEKACYRVRALLNYQGTLIPGPFSSPLCYP